MSEADAALLSRGGRGDFLPLGDALATYPPARADRLIGDGDRVPHGGVTLTAHLTPGHTKGCTTWTMAVTEGGDRHEVVFVGGTGVLPGVRLVDNPKYPGIAADFARTFHRLKSLPCDVFLAPHGFHFDLEEKARRLAAGEEPNPFLDPVGYKSFIDRSERVYLDQLRRERRNSTPPGEPVHPAGGRRTGPPGVGAGGRPLTQKLKDRSRGMLPGPQQAAVATTAGTTWSEPRRPSSEWPHPGSCVAVTSPRRAPGRRRTSGRRANPPG